MLVPLHEVHAVRSRDGQLVGLPRVSYVVLVAGARAKYGRDRAHALVPYTEDPADVPGKYGDGALAHITRSQTFSNERRRETRVREAFSAMAERWGADKPNRLWGA
jgi:hypothetical protein